MREKRSSERTQTVKYDKEPKKKYFFVFEGTETEEIYFDSVKDYFQSHLILKLLHQHHNRRSFHFEVYATKQVF